MVLRLGLALGGVSHAAAVTEEFQVEGLVSPASPKALAAALEEQLAVKVVGFDLRDTASGWPVVRVEFEEGAVTRDQIAASHRRYRGSDRPHVQGAQVGPPVLSASPLAEETAAAGVLGDPPSDGARACQPGRGRQRVAGAGAGSLRQVLRPSATGRTATAPGPRPTASTPIPASSGSGAAPATRPTGICSRSSPTGAPTCRPGACCSRRPSAGTW